MADIERGTQAESGPEVLPRASREPRHWLDYAMAIFTATAGIGAAVAAAAAAYQAAVAHDTEHAQLRAYVEASWKTDGEGIKFDPYRQVTLAFAVHNRGQTPAFGLVGRSHGEILDYPLPADFAYGQLKDQVPPVTVFPGADGPDAVGQSRLFTPAEREELKPPSKKRWVVYGQIDYRDLFGQPRTTRFCQTYRLLADESPMIEHCATGNEAD